MRFRLLVRVLLLSICGTAAPALAVIVPPVSIGITGGTLGIGPEVSYSFNPLLAIRGSATFLGAHGHGSSASYRYSGRLHVSNWGGTIDFHPFANGFRLSAGARDTEHDRVNFTGVSRSPRTFGNVTYTPDQAGTISGTIRTKSVAPIITAGYTRRLAGLTFGIDGGVMFHGTPRPENFSATGQLATNPNAQAEYLSQQQRVRDDVDGYKYYPVLQISLGYRF